MDKQTKKCITEVWLNAFPQLRPYNQDKLYKLIGCFIVGLELIKLPRVDNYRPHIAWYPLYKKTIEDCLKSPILHDEFYNYKGNQLNLPYEDKLEKFREAQSIVSASLRVSLNSDTVNLNDILTMADNNLFTSSNGLYSHHSGNRAYIYELKFYATLYTGDTEACENILQKIKEESHSWNIKGFELWHGPFENWFSNLNVMINNRAVFLRQIDDNKNDKKVSTLLRAEIIR